MKTCCKCKQAKPLSEFHRHLKSKDGLQGICKWCKKLYSQEYNGTKSKYHRNEQGLWCRKCPKCGKTITYNNAHTTENTVKLMTENKSTCLDCYNSSKIGRPFPSTYKAKARQPLVVGEKNTVKLSSDVNTGDTYMSFIVIEYVCTYCKSSITRKIPCGEPFDCLCPRCGKWNKVSPAQNGAPKSLLGCDVPVNVSGC